MLAIFILNYVGHLAFLSLCGHDELDDLVTDMFRDGLRVYGALGRVFARGLPTLGLHLAYTWLTQVYAWRKALKLAGFRS